MSEQPLLQVHNLKTYFYTEDGVTPSVDGVDFDLHEGETLAIVGESGCGKSVTSLSIMGLVQCPPGKIEAGEILYHGKDLLKISKKEMRSIRGNEISMMDNVIKRERAHKKVVAKCFRCRLKGRIDHPQQGEKYKEAYQQQG